MVLVRYIQVYFLIPVHCNILFVNVLYEPLHFYDKSIIKKFTFNLNEFLGGI